MIEESQFKAGMRRLAAGVSVITASEGGQRHGFLATAVSSVSAQPPSLLICVNRDASSHGPIDRTGAFCVNLLGAEPAQQALAARFSSTAHRHTRFDDGEWGELHTGSPVLGGALASFDCRVAHRIPAGTHTIFIGEVLALGLPATLPVPPLIYFNGSYV